MITSKQAARLRAKRKAGVKIGPKQDRSLDEYEAYRLAKATTDATTEADPDQQPTPAGVPGEGAGAGEVPPPAPAAELPPPLATPEAIPAIKIDAPTNATGARWQDKYIKSAGAVADGREMLCTFIGAQWRDALKSMETDLALVGVEPVIPADALYPVIVIALDQLLPERAKLTPPIAAVVGTSVTTVQRFRHHKKIVEAQNKDPSIQEYKRKAAEEAEKKRRESAVKDAEAKGIKSVPAQPTPQPPKPVETAEPPPISVAPTLSQTPSSKPITTYVDDGRPVF